MQSFVFSLVVHILLFSVVMHSQQLNPNQLQQPLSVPVEIIGQEPTIVRSPTIQKNSKSIQNSTVDINSEYDNEKTKSEATQTLVDLHKVGADGNQVFDYLVALIYKNRIYPFDSIRLNEQGQVTVSFYINEHGEITNISVVVPSKYKKLNSAAIQTLQSLKIKKEFPQIETLFGQQYSFTFDFEIT